MKFNDGFWLLKHSVKAYYDLQVTQSKTESDGVALQVATRATRRHSGRRIISRLTPEARGASSCFNAGPVLNVKVYSPTPGVIGVRIDYFKHSDEFPAIPLFPDVLPIPNVAVSRSDTTTILSTAGLTAESTGNPYTITFKDLRRALTAAGFKHQGVFDVPYRRTIGTAANSSRSELKSSPNTST